MPAITADELIAPGDDPREFAALRHNITQLQREIDELKAWKGQGGSSKLKRAGRSLLRR